MDMYTLLYIKWITNKNLLYSTENSTQYYVPAWTGGCLGENGYTCMSESLHCSPETSTALLVSYTPIQNVLGAKNKQMKIKENKNDPSY